MAEWYASEVPADFQQERPGDLTCYRNWPAFHAPFILKKYIRDLWSLEFVPVKGDTVLRCSSVSFCQLRPYFITLADLTGIPYRVSRLCSSLARSRAITVGRMTSQLTPGRRPSPRFVDRQRTGRTGWHLLVKREWPSSAGGGVTRRRFLTCSKRSRPPKAKLSVRGTIILTHID